MYRAGFASTRRAARQMVSHGHITVNGTRTTTPSHAVKKGDVLAVREGSRKSPLFAHLGDPEREVRSMPSWIEVDASLMQVKIVGVPQYAPAESTFDLPAVFEFYSR